MVRKTSKGTGLINTLVNKLPFELHLPGYQYCGPGTKLEKRLARGDVGVNQLDRACKEHDIAYNQYQDTTNRQKADRILAEKAWQRVKSSDSSLGEKAASWLVANTMKAKGKLGSGMNKKKKISFKNLVKSARVNDLSSILDASKVAYKRAKKHLAGKNKPLAPRVLPIPKTGGFLPFLVPIMAGLSAIGSLAGGAAAVARSVNQAREAKQKLDEQKRHNLAMEAQKIGNGLYLKPYRKGYGLFITQPNLHKKI